MDTKMRAYDTDVIEKIVTEEPEIPVYVPYASYNTPGIASFKSTDFHVEPTGKVQLSDEIYQIRDDAENAATKAAESAQAAAQSESNAKQSENAASQSESNALSSENAAKASQTAAESAKIAAEAAEVGAETAQSQAAGSASAAAGSATASAGSAFDSAESAVQAANSANAASDSAAQADTYATQAQQSAAQASNSASQAGTYAQNSANSATAAQGYAQQAQQYAQKHYQIVDSVSDLPRPGDSALIYLVPTNSGPANDSYSEYLWISESNDYEFIGTTTDIDLSNYAQINGTYSGMTVGKATQADNAATATDAEKLGGVLANQYAIVTGTYVDMTVGNATNAENANTADSATNAEDSAKLGGVAAANYAQIDGTYSGMTVGTATKATQDGNGDNIANTYAKQSGTYPNMTVGNASNAVNATKATQDGSGNNIAGTYATKTELSEGLAEKANTSGYYLDLRAGMADRSNRAEMAGSATRATYDSDDNNIADTYAKKSELNAEYTRFLSNSGLTSLVSSGYMDLYKIGKIIICTFSLTLNTDVSTWGTAMIFSFNTHSEFTPVPSQDKLIGTGMQSLLQGGQAPIEIIVNPSGIFVGGDSNKISKDMHLCGQVVYAIA